MLCQIVDCFQGHTVTLLNERVKILKRKILLHLPSLGRVLYVKGSNSEEGVIHEVFAHARRNVYWRYLGLSITVQICTELVFTCNVRLLL